MKQRTVEQASKAVDRADQIGKQILVFAIGECGDLSTALLAISLAQARLVATVAKGDMEFVEGSIGHSTNLIRTMALEFIEPSGPAN